MLDYNIFMLTKQHALTHNIKRGPYRELEFLFRFYKGKIFMNVYLHNMRISLRNRTQKC